MDLESTTPIRVYYAATDQRVHLFGANHAWLLVDYNYDREPDMRYDYTDADGDGYLDTWSLDVDMDGTADEAWHAAPGTARDVAYAFEALNQIQGPLLDTLPSALLQLDCRLGQALAASGGKENDPIEDLLASGFDLPQLPVDLRLRLLNSNETWRYYLDLLKDSRIAVCARSTGAGLLGGLRRGASAEMPRHAYDLGAGIQPVRRPTDFTAFRAAIVSKYDHPGSPGRRTGCPRTSAGNRTWRHTGVIGVSSTSSARRGGTGLPCLQVAPNTMEQDWGMDTQREGHLRAGGITSTSTRHPIRCSVLRGKVRSCGQAAGSEDMTP